MTKPHVNNQLKVDESATSTIRAKVSAPFRSLCLIPQTPCAAWRAIIDLCVRRMSDEGLSQLLAQFYLDQIEFMTLVYSNITSISFRRSIVATDN